MNRVEYEMDWSWDERGTVTVNYRTSETFRFVIPPGRNNRLALNSMLVRFVNDADLPFRAADANRILRKVMQVQGANV